MIKITKKELLDSIAKVYEQAKDCRLEKSFFDGVKSELSTLSRYFNTSESQAFFIATVFAMNYSGDSVGLIDLIKYFDCNPIKILEYNNDFEYLHQKGIFMKKNSYRQSLKLAGAKHSFVIHEKITEAILTDLPMPETAEKSGNTILDLLASLYELGQKRHDDEIMTLDLICEAKKLIDDFSHHPLIERLIQFELKVDEVFLFMYVTWKALGGRESVDVETALEGIYDRETTKLEEMQKIIFNKHTLLKINLIETIEASFSSDWEIKLTDVATQLLDDCGVKLFILKKKKDNIITPSDIVYRNLIFDEGEMQQLNTLENLLQESSFTETQNRLTEKGLPKGITVLLHGAPGTGKTEIVKQIAKATNREIMKVEISQSKSMWFGESEKIIKRIFTDYKGYVKECEQTPILFFNEADAIISKRGENSGSSVSQTQNTIQNILLEELENFEGILMATTNLANNLDAAFERRFLFKVPFQKPNTSTRTKIWKSKLPQLHVKDCKILAEKFDFSGGQIDNIIRKNEIQEIVHGMPTNFENILMFCNEESLSKQSKAIGFDFIRS